MQGYECMTFEPMKQWYTCVHSKNSISVSCFVISHLETVIPSRFAHACPQSNGVQQKQVDSCHKTWPILIILTLSGCIFPLQKVKIYWSICHKHSTIMSFHLSYARIQFHFKQLYYLDNKKKGGINTKQLNICDWILKYKNRYKKSHSELI